MTSAERRSALAEIVSRLGLGEKLGDAVAGWDGGALSVYPMPTAAGSNDPIVASELSAQIARDGPWVFETKHFECVLSRQQGVQLRQALADAGVEHGAGRLRSA
ncbi:MAG: hypothetical protein HY744_07370 [Deltaproteobacteria bacterium]|nr:hypothetical protein [Deltaproteobacteria bacterium]